MLFRSHSIIPNDTLRVSTGNTTYPFPQTLTFDNDSPHNNLTLAGAAAQLNAADSHITNFYYRVIPDDSGSLLTIGGPINLDMGNIVLNNGPYYPPPSLIGGSQLLLANFGYTGGIPVTTTTTTSTTSTTTTSTTTTSTTSTTTTTTTLAPPTTTTTTTLAPITTTTTTTASPCTNVIYGYDAYDTDAACADYSMGGTIYQTNGTTLYVYSLVNPCGPGAAIASIGFYSDGMDSYYWDGTTLSYEATCSTYTLTFRAKRRTGTLTTPNNVADIMVSTDLGATWTSAWTASSHALNTVFANVGSIIVPVGTTVYVGMKKTSSLINMEFAATSDIIPTYDQCGTVTPPGVIACYNYGAVYADDTVFLQANVSGGTYVTCP